jgi:hypothetical protein
MYRYILLFCFYTIIISSYAQININEAIIYKEIYPFTFLKYQDDTINISLSDCSYKIYYSEGKIVKVLLKNLSKSEYEYKYNYEKERIVGYSYKYCDYNNCDSTIYTYIYKESKIISAIAESIIIEDGDTLHIPSSVSISYSEENNVSVVQEETLYFFYSKDSLHITDKYIDAFLPQNDYYFEMKIMNNKIEVKKLDSYYLDNKQLQKIYHTYEYILAISN